MVGPGHSPLTDAIAAFIDNVTDALSTISHRDAAALRPDVANEVAALAAAVIDADDRRSDNEIWAYVEALGAEIDVKIAGATPQQLRDAGLFDGKRAWLDKPSLLFDLLVGSDRRTNRRDSHLYYRLAMKVAHTVASLDLVPSPSELLAIDSFRAVLLGALDRAAVSRPGAPVTTPPPMPIVDATPEPAALPALRPIEELLAELDKLVGLAPVKAEVRLVTNLLQVQKLRTERGLPIMDGSNHLVFTGNPGTGKTTVARLLAQIYRTLGVVSKGQLIETDRSKLVAGYVGQTAIKTAEVVAAAAGGILLIDEAYALARGGDNDFGREAIDTLVKLMEDARGDLAVIAAGYTAEMAEFIATNPGLRSRFTRTIDFPDYSDDELVAIFCRLGETHRYRPTAAAITAVRAVISAQPRDKGFGNARFVRNIFERAVGNQAMRVVALAGPSDDVLTTLEAADISQ